MFIEWIETAFAQHQSLRSIFVCHAGRSEQSVQDLAAYYATGMCEAVPESEEECEVGETRPQQQRARFGRSKGGSKGPWSGGQPGGCRADPPCAPRPFAAQ